MWIRNIEVVFPCGIEVPEGFCRQLSDLVDTVCKKYETDHPGTRMWAMEHGPKIILMPWTKEGKEEGIQLVFDDSIYYIRIGMREKLARD